MPDGPANAMDPTTIGNQTEENISDGRYPNANMPPRVLPRSAQLPTIDAAAA
jgi:hypothetical protein